MKKNNLLLIATATMLAASSCSHDEIVDTPQIGEGNVSFAISLPGASFGTRAFADGLTADKLQIAVYDAELNNLVTTKDLTFGNKLTTNVSLNLATGRSYKIAFFAQSGAEGVYTFNTTDRKIEVNYEAMTEYNSSDKYDCFYKLETIEKVTGPVSRNITLTRPVAQINWGTNDLADAVVTATDAYGTGAEKLVTKVSAHAYTEFDMMTSDVIESSLVTTDIVFPHAARPSNDEVFPVKAAEGENNYEYLSMQYLLVPTATSVIDLKLEATNVRDGASMSTVTVANAPVQANYRTNIYGSLLTNPANITVTKDENFEGEYNQQIVKDASGFIAALSNPNVREIIVEENIDLKEATIEELTFQTPKVFSLENGTTITLGNENRLTAENGLKIIGKGKITNTSADNSNIGEGHQKSLIHVMSGDLIIEGTTLENDPNYHFHGNAAEGRPYNSAAIAYWNDANVIINNAHITSGEFTICGMGRDSASGSVILTDSYFESTSSNIHNGKNWAYAMRLFGTKAVLNNCEVKGTQGGVSTDGCLTAEINGGKYYTVNTPGKTDAFYPLYITNGTIVTINGGEFSSPNDRSRTKDEEGNSIIGGTSAVVCGDNDIALVSGSVIIKGGKFSGKAYNYFNNKFQKLYDVPAEGYEWKAIEGNDTFKWEVVKSETVKP